ncbi:RDD family protein [Helicobacter marmotae]|uniref:RDD family protein n=1 Tax=Helicobacter marmotae TaxID=152490 RepID=A0A3D8I4T3_9HELI|nr:RDD family protein [Helicobacter marmotae]RDU59561.1 RDD family protein [Helicobacter marmotae]
MTEEAILENLARENLQLASKALRSLAWFIDMFLLSLVFVFIHFDTLSQIQNTSAHIDYGIFRGFLMQYAWQVWVLKIAYDTLFVWYYGSSIGKLICKMRVVSVDLFDKPHFLSALFRSIAKYIGESLLYITYIFGLGDRCGRSLHDRLAKTLVIAY